MKKARQSKQPVRAGKQRIRIRVPVALVKELRRRLGSGRFAAANYFKNLLQREF